MRADIKFIEQKFREYNAMCFDGKLPTVPISLSQAKTYLGICAYKKHRSLFGKAILHDFHLRFSTRLDLPQDMLEDIILHEMIHLYIGVNNIKDSSAHGKVFRSIMQQINTQYGRHIAISHHTTDEQRQNIAETRVRYHVIAAVTFTDGRTGVKVLPRIMERIRNYYNAVIRAKGIKSIDFYMSKDPFFSRYPNSGAFKVYAIKTEELYEHLADAKPINDVCLSR